MYMLPPDNFAILLKKRVFLILIRARGSFSIRTANVSLHTDCSTYVLFMQYDQLLVTMPLQPGTFNSLVVKEQDKPSVHSASLLHVPSHIETFSVVSLSLLLFLRTSIPGSAEGL